ncbi:unnamed protein product [Leptidea sinapis]|uniref:Enoyl-[acyl-carrier-protein] reductase, mitochondrial n=1 Tax=Leptidea sinapis TaxID=189913 RepID=A0A5E4Q1M8_9NEOP|nr:unnamed protein product [Leptidea sinapis]
MKILSAINASRCVLTLLKPNKTSIIIRITQQRNLMSKQLVYDQFGDPLHVVKFRESEVPALGPTDVLVRMLAAPVNPADINTIQGKYPVKVSLPSIPGNEGVGSVVDIGKNVKGISKSSKVILNRSLMGTWRDYAVLPEESLLVVPDDLGNVEAATISVNPCTAYRMLMDFVPLQAGDVVIQNGGNSACGQYVIQICKAWGVKTVNIVRDRPDIAKLKEYLQNLGATYVLTEEELRSTQIFKDGLKKPLLALNCVGGKSSSQLFRYLNDKGVMVTYGGMSREPVIVPTSAFIFKDMKCEGFWMTAWNHAAPATEKDKMIKDIISLMVSKQVKAPIHKMIKFDNFEEALKNAVSPQGFTGCKFILDFC